MIIAVSSAILLFLLLVVFRLVKQRAKRKVISKFVVENTPSQDAPLPRKQNDEVIHIIRGYLEELKQFISSEDYLPHSEMEQFLVRLNKPYQQIDAIIRFSHKNSVEYALGKEFCNRYRQLNVEREVHNRSVVTNELERCAEFFDTVLDYPLDPQQRRAILELEDNCLVVSSAGSGKTSTMCGKVKYLVEQKRVDPQKILLITYTRKAAESLSLRLAIPGLKCYTFHKLALDIIAQSTNEKPSLCSESIFVSVYDSLKGDGEFQKSINRYLASYQSNMKDEFEYEDAESYIADRKKYGIQSPYPDMDGRTIYTKSEQEKKICIFLSEMGVRFRYETPYEHKVGDTAHRQYTPDFTIYFKGADGELQHLYLEHFGIDANGNVAKWMGDGEEGGWEEANRKYNEGIEWKKEIHQKYGSELIYTTSADFSNRSVYQKLRNELQSRGVVFNPMTEEQKSQYLLGGSKRKERVLIEMLSSFILLMKGRCKRMDDIVDMFPKNPAYPEDVRKKFIVTRLVKPFYERYVELLKERGEIDFTDAILWATRLCKENMEVDYDYILVDEFQDISFDRYEFLKSLRRDVPKTKLFCVGDDWQSIYRFSGSDLTLFTRFREFFGYTVECNIETTYRFGDPMLQLSSDFIKRNPTQKQKSPRSFSDQVSTHYEFVGYVGEDGKEGKEGAYYTNTLKTILDKIPADKSLILVGRYTMDVEMLRLDFECKMIGDRVEVVYGNRCIPFLTAHQSKGLEADYVVLLRCNSGSYGFPSTITDDPILSFVLSEDDVYSFGEERRLFYVALTRAKHKTYVLYDVERPSCFVEELISDIARNVTTEERMCPKCKSGSLVKIKSGVAKSGYLYNSYACSNKSFGCDYFHTDYFPQE